MAADADAAHVEDDAGEDEVTVLRRFVLDEAALPRLVDGVELTRRPMSPFEAFLLSFLDGHTSVGEVALAAGLSAQEACAALTSLCERGVVQPQSATPCAPSVPLARAPLTRVAAPAQPLAAPLEDSREEGRGGDGARPPEATAGLLAQVEVLEQRGELKQAVALLQEGLSRHARPAPLLHRLALLLLRQGRELSLAVQLLQHALRLEPECARYQESLVRALELDASGAPQVKQPHPSR